MATARKPIRVFYSTLTNRFYATRAYRIDAKGIVTVTGEKFDVTDDIANLIDEHGVEFRVKEPVTERNGLRIVGSLGGIAEDRR